MNDFLNKINIKPKAFFGLIIALLIYIISLCIPSIGMLSDGGIRVIGLFLSFLIILITDALPVVVTSLIFLGLMAMSLGTAGNAADVGIGSLQGALSYSLSGFSEPVVYFTLASFGLTAAITTTPLSKRILKGLLKIFGKNIKSVLLAIMIASCIISSMISNVPTCAVFMGVALNFLNLYKDKQEKRKTAKAFLIAVPIASMIGGMMTPAGSSINLMAIGILERTTGTTITFAQWMVAGIPLAIIMLPLAWWLITIIYKPVNVNNEDIKTFADELEVPNKITVNEIKTIVIALTMLVLWILSSWISFFNVMIISLFGCALLFLPGINVINVDTFLKENSWDAFFLVGLVISLGGAMSDFGVMNVIGQILPSLNFNIVLVLAIVCLITFICLVIDPVATSLVSILGPILITLGASTTLGIDNGLATMIILAFSMCLCNCYLLPLDTVPLITYSKGFYSMTDMLKSTSILQLVLLILVSLWIPVVGLLFGLI